MNPGRPPRRSLIRQASPAPSGGSSRLSPPPTQKSLRSGREATKQHQVPAGAGRLADAHPPSRPPAAAVAFSALNAKQLKRGREATKQNRVPAGAGRLAAAHPPSRPPAAAVGFSALNAKSLRRGQEATKEGVPGVGFELTRPFGQRILSPGREGSWDQAIYEKPI